MSAYLQEVSADNTVNADNALQQELQVCNPSAGIAALQQELQHCSRNSSAPAGIATTVKRVPLCLALMYFNKHAGLCQDLHACQIYQARQGLL